MWPKAIAQLIELLPHISRLLPLADRFLSAKSADAEASRTAMQQMAEGLRGDLGQVTASHAGLYRQINDVSERLGAASAEVGAMKAAVEALGARQRLLEQRLGVVVALCAATAVLGLLAAVLCGLILVRLHRGL